MKTIRFIAASTALALGITTTSAPVFAAMVGNSSLVESAQSVDRGELKAFFDREDIATAMQGYGVSPEMAKKRVDSMTDAEAARLADHIQNEPAGAGVVGTLFAVFVILLVTDILGLTKVFPFTRSVR